MSSELAPDVLSNHSSSADANSNRDIDDDIDQNIIDQGNQSMAIDEVDPSVEAEPSNHRHSKFWRSSAWLRKKLPQTLPEPIQKISQKISQTLPKNLSLGWVILGVSIGGVIFTTMWGLQYLTALESNPDSSLDCQSKIAGDWQTPFGKISLQETGNQQVAGQYEYSNLDRGKVKGEFTGKLRNNVINFVWKEGKNQPSDQQGKGIFVFSEGCMEFYGSYGIADSTNNFGNWQGYRISK